MFFLPDGCYKAREGMIFFIQTGCVGLWRRVLANAFNIRYFNVLFVTPCFCYCLKTPRDVILLCIAWLIQRFLLRNFLAISFGISTFRVDSGF
jgi:hypothetical protein